MGTSINMLGGGGGGGITGDTMLTFNFASKPNINQKIIIPLAQGIVITFPTDLEGSIGIAQIAAAAQTDFDVQKNGSSVATVRFAASGTVPTFICAADFTIDGNSGDNIAIVAASVQDTTLSSISISLKGIRS
jgi:hypothetical protein